MRGLSVGAVVVALALAGTGGAWAVARLAAKQGVDGVKRPLGHAPNLGTRAACERYTGMPRDSSSGDEHAGMVWVEGGSFMLGSRHGYGDERPASELTTVAGFWIDRTEVTNAQFAAFVDATAYVTEAERDGVAAVFEPANSRDGAAEPVVDGDAPTWWRRVAGTSWRHPDGPATALDGRENQPVVQVTQADAAAYARWRGRELPTEAEWEFAARSGGAPDAAGAPRDQSGHPMANFWQGTFPTENVAEDGYRGRAPVGCFPANRLGIHDMIGNVWELTSDPYRGQRPAHCTGHVDGPKNLEEEPSVIKGGSFLCAASYCARYRASARHPHEAHLAAAHVGFRTVARAKAAP
jgi:sulfatase modifying factor 1